MAYLAIMFSMKGRGVVGVKLCNSVSRLERLRGHFPTWSLQSGSLSLLFKCVVTETDPRAAGASEPSMQEIRLSTVKGEEVISEAVLPKTP